MKLKKGDKVKIRCIGVYYGEIATICEEGPDPGVNWIVALDERGGTPKVFAEEHLEKMQVEDGMDNKFKKGDRVVSKTYPDIKYLYVTGVFAKPGEWWYYVQDWGEREPPMFELPEWDLTLKGEDEEPQIGAVNAERSLHRHYKDSIIALIDTQTAKGMKKYGGSLEENFTLTTQQRIEHLEEELVDGLMYMEHLKTALDCNGITADDYQRAALRTARTDEMSPDDLLQNGVMGLCGEAGEVIDLVKKTMFQGHDLDKEKMKLELGDVLWYAAVASHALGFKLSDVMEANVEKLKKRFPDGFDKARSIHRAEDTSEDEGCGFAD